MTFPIMAAAALYRITQEALANAVKHADADRIVLSLRGVGDSIVLGLRRRREGFRRKRNTRRHARWTPMGLSTSA